MKKPDKAAASREAEQLIKKLGITDLPIDPIKIAESFDIMVKSMPADGGVSGMLIRKGNEFCIGYATHIQNEGFRRFSIAHEIGHYILPGHVDAVFAHEDIHSSNAGFTTNDPFEREADIFAASLLMPNDLFTREMKSLGDGLAAVETLSKRFTTSLIATASRYVEKAEIPVAMIVSSGNKINYCFMSDSLRDFRELEWLRKGDPLPEGTETKIFNSSRENVVGAERVQERIELKDWFGGSRSIPGIEEIIGLGRYGKTLTILKSDIFADDEYGDEDLTDSKPTHLTF